MNTKLNFIIALLLSFELVAQPNLQTSVDSLENWIAQNPQRNDTTFINNLIKLEDNYYRTQPQKIGKWASLILKLSKENNYTYGKEKGLAFAAYQAMFAGKFDITIRLINAKLYYDNKAKNLYEQASSYSILGYIYSISQNNYKKSIEYFKKSIHNIEQLPDNDKRKFRTLAIISSNLSATYSGNKQYELAIEQNKKALAILTTKLNPAEEGYFFQKAAFLLNLGVDYNLLGQWQKSVH